MPPLNKRRMQARPPNTPCIRTLAVKPTGGTARVPHPSFTIKCESVHTVPMRFFNTTGPVVAKRHYQIPPLERVDLDGVLELIQQSKYFILHAPRQTGKTSMLLALADLLNSSGEYRCVYANIETAQTAREDVGRAMQAILNSLVSATKRMLDEPFLGDIREEVLGAAGPDEALAEALTRWSEADSRPLVLLLDEIDALIGDTLVSVLRQLRSRYPQRPAGFPQSVILCGVRDIRDYRIHASSEKTPITGGSAFNIKAESLRLGDFSEAEARVLLAQHSTETGQPFDEAAIARIVDSTCGQPWLVNALAYETCFRGKAAREARKRREPITAAAVDAAREALILRRETHLDQLADKLQEERVRRVVEPMLAGREKGAHSPRDLEYVRDLGLVALDAPVRIANPIYAEVVPRELTWLMQEEITEERLGYLAEKTLDMERLLQGFQSFNRDNGESWMARFAYREAGPQLLLQAYLQRVVNGGGRIEREYALGRRRTDLLVCWPQGAGRADRRIVIECKVRRGAASLASVIAQGVAQTRDYMDKCGTAEGHLVVFESDESKPWSERLFRREEAAEDPAVIVWGA